ncbi:MAG: DUF1566 domain-containing protein [Alkalimonas sp.]|nr:DUF1566 domain-containing protein [Alkalimonas sp.]
MAEGDKAKAESGYLRLRVQQLAQQYGVNLTDANPKTESKSQRSVPAIAAVAVVAVVAVAGWWLWSQNTTDSGGGAQSTNSAQSSTQVQSTTTAQSAPSTSGKPASSAAKATLIDGRYRDNGNGTITDTKTNLTWMRCSLGQQWTGSTCAGVAMGMPWNDALRTAMSYSYAGHSDWRVPTVDELDTLVQCPAGRRPRDAADTGGYCHGSEYNTHNEYIKSKSNNPKININTFPNTPANWFWSSSPRDLASSAWSVNFERGHVAGNGKSDSIMVRLVRAGQ